MTLTGLLFLVVAGMATLDQQVLLDLQVQQELTELMAILDQVVMTD